MIAIFDVIAANDGVTPEKTALATELHEAGIYENRDGTDHSAVLAWLAHPGVEVVHATGRGRWTLGTTRFRSLAGLARAQVDALMRLDPVQIALLVELARAPRGRSDSGRMQRLLALRPDLEFSGPGFRRLYIDPLVKQELVRVTGRGPAGSTAFQITATGRREAAADLLARFDADGTLRYLPSDLLAADSGDGC